MVIPRWVGVTAALAAAGFAAGMLLASLAHVTLDHGPGRGAAATAAVLVALAAVPALAGSLRRLGRAAAGSSGAADGPLE